MKISLVLAVGRHLYTTVVEKPVETNGYQTFRACFDLPAGKEYLVPPLTLFSVVS